MAGKIKLWISHNGKTVLITERAKGIGLAIALRFAASGANVAIVTKDSAANIDRAADQVIAAGGQALALHANICNHNEIKNAVSETIARFGSIDILVNNTSATCFNETLNTTPEQFDLVISTSVRAAFACTESAFLILRMHKIHTSSTSLPRSTWRQNGSKTISRSPLQNMR